MVILGIDPGPTKTAWALVDCAGARPRFIARGVTASEYVGHACSGHIDDMVRFDACAVEKPVPPHPGGKANTPQAWRKITCDLMATALVAGEALGVASEHCAPVEYLTSHTVRKALCGKANADDADVKRALQLIVDGLPSRTDRKSVV